MKLLTKKIEKFLEKYSLTAQDEKGFNAKVLVEYFNPYGRGTWLITGGEKQEDGDWLLYGFINLDCSEWGYVYLSDLEAVQASPMLATIEYNKFLDKDATVASECQRLNISLFGKDNLS